MHRDSNTGRPPTYEIVLQGRLDKDWSEWLDGLEICHEGDQTVLRGNVRDQAALRGLLGRVWDLNRKVISVTKIEDPPPKGKETKMDNKKEAKTKEARPVKKVPSDAFIAGPNGNVPVEVWDCGHGAVTSEALVDVVVDPAALRPQKPDDCSDLSA